MSVTPPETAPADPYGPHKQIVSSIYEMSPEALEQLAMWIEQRGIRTPIANVVGYTKDSTTTCALLRTATAQTINAGVTANIVFDAATFDPQKMWDGTSTVTVRTNGLYQVVGWAQCAANATPGFVQLGFGGVGFGIPQGEFCNPTGQHAIFSEFIALTAGAAFTLRVNNGTAGNLNYLAGVTFTLVTRF